MTAKTARVLVVDDDPAIQRMICDYLSHNSLSVATAPGWMDMRRLLEGEAFDLIILDMKLGSDDGLEVLRDIRLRSDIPVIVITGYRRDEIDRVLGVELGADDYITKPFGLHELLARIRVILRRTDATRAAAQGKGGSDRAERTFRFGRWTLDKRLRQLTDGRSPVVLTKAEYGLLVAFLDAPQQTLSREHLLGATRIHEDVFDRTVDVQILRLRRKLEADPSAPDIIKTERGIGYVFTLPVEAA